jgi:hypothetical protein
VCITSKGQKHFICDKIEAIRKKESFLPVSKRFSKYEYKKPAIQRMHDRSSILGKLYCSLLFGFVIHFLIIQQVFCFPCNKAEDKQDGRALQHRANRRTGILLQFPVLIGE